MRGKRRELRWEFTRGDAQVLGWQEVTEYPYKYYNVPYLKCGGGEAVVAYGKDWYGYTDAEASIIWEIMGETRGIIGEVTIFFADGRKTNIYY